MNESKAGMNESKAGMNESKAGMNESLMLTTAMVPLCR